MFTGFRMYCHLFAPKFDDTYEYQIIQDEDKRYMVYKCTLDKMLTKESNKMLITHHDNLFDALKKIIFYELIPIEIKSERYKHIKRDSIKSEHYIPLITELEFRIANHQLASITILGDKTKYLDAKKVDEYLSIFGYQNAKTNNGSLYVLHDFIKPDEQR